MSVISLFRWIDVKNSPKHQRVKNSIFKCGLWYSKKNNNVCQKLQKIKKNQHVKRLYLNVGYDKVHSKKKHQKMTCQCLDMNYDQLYS